MTLILCAFGISGAAIAQRQSGFVQSGGLAIAPWPKFHANNANTGLGQGGSSAGIIDVESIPPATLYSQAIGTDGTVYAGAADGNLYALDPSSGAVKWSYGIGGSDDVTPAISSSGVVYAGSSNGTMYALNAQTGALDWSYLTGGAISSAPAIESGGTVVFGSEDGNVYDLNGTDGTQSWNFTSPDGGIFEDPPAIGSDGSVYIGDSDGVFYALDGSTGAELWQNNDFFAQNISGGAAIGSDGTLFVQGYNLVEAIDPSTGVAKWSVPGLEYGQSPAIGPSGTLYYVDGNDGLVALNPSTGARIWAYNASYAESDLAIGSDETIYFGDDNSHFDAVNGATGSLKWSDPLFVLSAPAIAADGSVYCSGHYGSFIEFGTNSFSHFYASPATLSGTGGTNCVIQMAKPAPPAGYTVRLQSSSTDIYVPYSVTIPGGSKAVSVAVYTSEPASAEAITLTASIDASSVQTTVNLSPNSIKSFTASPATVSGGVGTTGVVSLSGVAGTSGDTITLQSSSGDVSLPSSETVYSGSKGVSFAMSTSAVSAPETVTLTATLGASVVQTTITLTPAPISNVYTSPASVTGGHSTRGVVQLAGQAGLSGDMVALSSGSADATVPGTVTIPAGGTGVSFAIDTSVVSSSQSVAIMASLGSSTKSANLTVNPAPISNFYASPSAIAGGSSCRGVVQLSGPAGPNGDVATLQSGSADATVPASVTVPAGSTGASFAISSSTVISSESIQLTATLGGSSAQTTLTVNPVSITNFYASPSSVTGGVSTHGVVQLSLAAGSGGEVVSLSCPDSNVTVPSTVTVTQGSTGASFSITTKAVATQDQATITATLGTSSQQATLTLNPPAAF